MRNRTSYIVRSLQAGVLAAALLSGAACAQEPPPAEIRAVWASTLRPAMNDRQEIRELVAAARRANLNTVIAQVRHRGVVFYRSDLEPMSPTVAGGPDFDPLAALLDEARDTSGGGKRLDVYAWFNVFKLGRMPGQEGSADAETTGKLTGWLSRDTTGAVQDFLDPALPEVHDHLIGLVAECVSKYPVDGVNLDYIRYPEEEAGFHPRAVERFNRLTGRTGSPAPGDARWNAFRRDQVSAFVRRCSVTVWGLRPDCVVSVNAVGFGGPPRRDFSDSTPYRQVHQDWAGWMQDGTVDAVTRMGYKRESVAAHAKDFRSWADFSKQLQEKSQGRVVSLGIRGYLNSLPEVLAQYREARKRGLGASVFSYETPVKESRDKKRPRGASPLWDALAVEIYPNSAPLFRPTWRKKSAVLYGTLNDDRGRPMDQARVALKGGSRETAADGSGFFAFVGLEPGEYEIEAVGSLLHGRRVRLKGGAVERLAH